MALTIAALNYRQQGELPPAFRLVPTVHSRKRQEWTVGTEETSIPKTGHFPSNIVGIIAVHCYVFQTSQFQLLLLLLVRQWKSMFLSVTFRSKIADKNGSTFLAECSVALGNVNTTIRKNSSRAFI